MKNGVGSGFILGGIFKYFGIVQNVSNSNQASLGAQRGHWSMPGTEVYLKVIKNETQSEAKIFKITFFI